MLIPAAGVGSRMRANIPKQYLKVHGRTILEHTLSRFYELPSVIGVLVVVSESDPYINALSDHLLEVFEKRGVPLCFTVGGNERSETVAKGIEYLIREKAVPTSQWLMVHDAARPCVRQSDLLKLIDANKKNKDSGAILGVPVRDTLKKISQKNTIIATQPRASLWQAQTPQLFSLGVLRDSLSKALKAGVMITDEASAMEYCDKAVTMVEGSSDNIKLTTPSDLAIIDSILKDVGGGNGF